MVESPLHPLKNAGDVGDAGSNPWVGKIPWRRKWPPTPIFLPGESHGQRSLVCYSPWGRKVLDTTEQLSTAQQRAYSQKSRIKRETEKLRCLSFENQCQSRSLLRIVFGPRITCGFPGGSAVKNLPANTGDTGLIPKLGRSSGEGNGNPLQYS